jgi:hypothetical protein
VVVPPSPPNKPQITYVGIFISDIHGLDLKASNYTVDFYIWFRWQGNLDPSNFEFLNGSLDLKEHAYRLESHGIHYVSYHCHGTFHFGFDYHDYPLDEHQLVLEMEDGFYSSDRLRYVVDAANMQNLRTLRLPGWTCSQPRFEVDDYLYHTNFGDPTESPGSSTSYSRLYCVIDISRHSYSIYLKTFLGIFIAVGIGYISFFFEPGDIDPRIAVGVAAIFAAVSSQFIATANLPDMPYMTRADKIHILSMSMIFLSLLVSCLSLYLYRKGHGKLSIAIDRTLFFVYPLFYIVGIAIFTLGS